MKRYYAKVHRIQEEVILAVCDAEIYNRSFRDGKLKFFTDPKFYGDMLFSDEEILKLFEEATILNLAGENCIKLAIEKELVDPENVLSIDKCRHAQVLK